MKNSFNRTITRIKYELFIGVWKMTKVFFTEEDRKNLKILREELPKIRLLLEELVETLEVLGDEELMESIKASEDDVKEGRLIDFKDLLKELHLNEQEV
ncbi:hypothetical protein DRO47_01325 [Candidatus Bathyarchaeota archaeon]|nr:MAG: hypothetical protein CW709_00290 [Candidatus Bathyarchaeota archaeon]RLI23178.1 MAG: hypothetical protein DRO47_01325 [Candidatus Bathyarchaeota archaeon]